jgi:hypothetical protein
MTVTRYTFESGANGADVGVGGDITAVSGSAPTYSNAAATHGSNRGISAVSTQWAEWAAPDADWSFSWYHTITVNPGTGSERVIVFRSAAGANVGAIRFHSSGAIAIVNGSNVVVDSNASTTWAADDDFRLDVKVNTIAPDVEISVRIFKNANVDGTSPDETYTRTLTAVDVAHARFGQLDSGSWTTLFDNLAISDLLEWIGPYTPAEPLDTPVVTVTEENPPTTPGGTDGSIKVTWPAISGADHYQAGRAAGHDITGGFTIVSSTATSPYTFTGLGAGNYTVAIRAVP